MAVAMILDWPGVTQEQYDKVIDSMDLGGRAAAGGYFHVAGPYEGGWRAVDVWESEETADAFFAQHTQAFMDAGVPPPNRQVWPVHNTLTPSGPAF